MAGCTVQGCRRAVGFESRGLSRDAAIFGALVCVLEKATEQFSDRLPADIGSFLDWGRGLSDVLHARAHGVGPAAFPVQELIGWKNTATASFEGIAISDPDWFRSYWTDVEDRGLRLPYAIQRLLRTADEAGRAYT